MVNKNFVAPSVTYRIAKIDGYWTVYHKESNRRVVDAWCADEGVAKWLCEERNAAEQSMFEFSEKVLG